MRTGLASVAGALVLGIWSGGAGAEPMRFTSDWQGGNCESCSWIRAEGTIEHDTPEKFLQFLKDDEGFEGKFVYFNSPGGNLAAGLKLGRIIRQRKFNTAVGSSREDQPGSSERRTTPARCASACGFAFLGGVVRVAKANEIGLHQFYMSFAQERPDAKVFSAIDASNDQILTGLLLEYTTGMGVDARYVRIAAATRPNEMHYLSEREVNDLRVNWEPDEFLPWTIEAVGDGIMAVSKSKGRNLTAALFCRKDKSVWFRFSVMKEGERHRLEGLGSVRELAVFGFPAGVADFVVEDRSWNQTLDVRLRQFDLARLPKDADDFVIDPVESFKGGHGVFTKLNPKGAEMNFRAALRNCL
ncbi:hypothetical protein [Xanthobacter tagetidis]|uniref:COG3904 family protein n=1 Tax=Xanthobacter tagetidis TaxID=60216 RepID=UPI0011C48C55|nr:hypothetical protein [Xanthobacter tagetidis]MBB6307972.1 hypothetical protein [Xanthobacter tagetidis]